MSIAAEAVCRYFRDRHKALNQTDLISFHVEFLSKRAVGNASISVLPLKIGRQFSTARVNLSQWDIIETKPIICLEALVTQGNLTTETQSRMVSLGTAGGLLYKSLIPKREICKKLETDGRLHTHPHALYKIESYIPPASDPGICQQWVRWAPGVGDTFTISSLAFLVDCFIPFAEIYGIENRSFSTLSYSIEIKKAPPTAGWAWLFLRIELGTCIGGWQDYALVIIDDQCEVIALSHHTVLASAKL
jgi:hypothetical protein